MGKGQGYLAAAVDRPSLVRICLDVPAFALSAVIVVALAVILGFWPWGLVIIVGWLASGPVILLRSVEEWIISRRDGLRRPSREELARLVPCWLAVTKAAEVHPDHYSLWIQKSFRVNAFATSGHTVAVTEAAVQKMAPSHLEAVLAHELGHHLGGHAWASLLRYWYSLPASYVFQFSSFFGLALVAALASGNIVMGTLVGSVTIGLLGYLLAAYPLGGALAVLFLLLPLVLLWVRRSQEHEADAIAARIGYGAALGRLLIASAPEPTEKPAWSSWFQKISETHPSNLERAERLGLWPVVQNTAAPQTSEQTGSQPT